MEKDQKAVDDSKAVDEPKAVNEPGAKEQHKEGKKQRNTADLLVECLQEEGVKYIFGIPGEENLALMNAIDASPIHFITTRHEQGAAFMADVYGRLTGKAGGVPGYAGAGEPSIW